MTDPTHEVPADPPIRFISLVEAIRVRPGMYVGSRNAAGLFHYLVGAVGLLLHRGARRISWTPGDEVRVASDAAIAIVAGDHGLLAPFEALPHPRIVPDDELEGPILNALSASLDVTVRTAGGTETLSFREGVRTRHGRSAATRGPHGTTLRFRPDPSIFETLHAPTAAMESLFRRLSPLHGGVRFALRADGRTRVVHAPRGLADLFDAVASPYQILHEPVHILVERDDLHLELIYAFQNAWDDHLVAVINGRCAAEGGTHEVGLQRGLAALKGLLGGDGPIRNGAIAVATLSRPGVLWAGATRERVNDPSLTPLVASLVVDETLRWLNDRPDVRESVRCLRPFTDPAPWPRA